MSKRKIYNFFQANFLIENGAKVCGCGLNGSCYVEFVFDDVFDRYMEIWRTRKPSNTL